MACGVGRWLEASLSKTSSELGRVRGVVGMLVDRRESCPHRIMMKYNQELSSDYLVAFWNFNSEPNVALHKDSV